MPRQSATHPTAGPRHRSSVAHSQHACRSRWRARLGPWLLAWPAVMLALLGCGGDSTGVTYGATIRVVNERNQPIAGATVDLGGKTLTTNKSGNLVLHGLDGPVLAVIEHDGFLPEPVPIGRDDISRTVFVTLLSDRGGARWTMHCGGDAMLGRRYQQPTSGEPLLPADDIAGGARYVVEHLSRAFAVADFRIHNLETVVSELPPTAAYPGKRFILNSHPDSLAGLEALGTQAVVLANNHIRDYLEEGARQTMAALEAAGIQHTGGSDGTGLADEPLIFELAGARIGVLAWNTVDGTYVNDQYPEDGDPVPPDVEPGEMWQYERRPWGYSGAAFSAPVVARRIGSAWRLFRAAESTLSPTDVVQVWSSLVEVYPELQDWSARRGHGGAAPWTPPGRPGESPAKIAALAEIVDVVVVQFHSGFQFQDAPSPYVRQIARQAIDAGAKLVVAHHPHVLQGAEWYRDGLIAYSMGNFLFDQDFLATFPSTFLRTVWEGATLIEARFVMLDIAGYRPMPTADKAAERNVLSLWEKSVNGAISDRDRHGDVRVFLQEPDDPSTRQAHLRMRHHDAVITDVQPPVESISVTVPAGAIVPVGYSGLIHAQAGGADVLIGRDTFGWGHLEDGLADGQGGMPAHWKIEHHDAHYIVGRDAAEGLGYLRMERTSKLTGDTYARAVARIPLPAHRLFTGDEDKVATPADGVASYTVRLEARQTGGGKPYLRLDLYRFDDTNPTEDPSSLSIGSSALPIDIPADGAWHMLDLELHDSVLVSQGQRANMVLLNVRFSPPEQGTSRFDIDDIAFIEWRPARDNADRYGAYHFVRNTGATDITAVLRGMPLRD